MEKNTLDGSKFYRASAEKVYQSVKIMRIGRTLPPAASPIPLIDIIRALPACLNPNDYDVQFEREIEEVFGAKHCFLLSSGKASLTLSLLALKKIYPDRNQVVLPAFTCYSVPAAVKRAGLEIRLCDLALNSLDLSFEQLKNIIETDRQSKKILCVLATHLFGCPSDLSAMRSIVGPEIPVIEDAAQAMGEKCDNKKLGTLGDMGFFSLGRGKALSAMEGGIILTNRDDLAEILKSLIVPLTGYSVPDTLKLMMKSVVTTILQYPSIFWLPKALPFLRLGETLYEPDFSLRRLSSFQVKLARNWQKRLKSHREERKKNINYWWKMLPTCFTHVCRKTNSSLIRLPVLASNRKQRNHILNQSEQKGLGIMPGYPTPIHNIPAIEEEFLGQEYPQAEDVCNRLLTIPVHEYIINKDHERIFALLAEFKG